MTDIKYSHGVEYDSLSEKILIHRHLDGGKKHLYTEISIAEMPVQERNLSDLGRILGEALILDMIQLRDKIL